MCALVSLSRDRHPPALTALLGLLCLGCAPLGLRAASGDPVLINELLASHAGSDDTEFVELVGTPGLLLEGLSLLVVEGDGAAGTIDRRIDFGAGEAIGDNGFFLVGNPAGLAANYGVVPNLEIAADFFENGSLTVALVETASLAGGVGSTVTGGETLRDAIALSDGDAGDAAFLGAPAIGPDGRFFPAGARRLVDGVDTDTAVDWTFADFSLGAANTPTGATLPPPPPARAATIMEIQGEAQRSPLEGERVATSGIVSAVAGRGFYLQDAGGDGNEFTSDALFVFVDGAPAVAAGDAVDVVGEVSEFVPGGAGTGNLPTTQIAFPESIVVVSSGNSLPEPARIGGRDGRAPPTRVIDDDALESYDPLDDGIDFFESLEAMRVTVVAPLAVSGTNRFGELFTVAGDGRRPRASGLSRRGTLNIAPDDFNPERVQLQLDGDLLPGFSLEVDTGARLDDVTGVVGYAFGNFEVLVTEPFGVRRPSRLRPETTRLGRSRDPRRLAIASYNVLNLDPKVEEGVSAGDVDDDVGDGRFDAIAGHIVENLGAPAIVALQEVQDGDGAEDEGLVSAEATLRALVGAIVRAGGPAYLATDNPYLGDGTSGGQPGGNIRVAFLHDPERVELAGVEPVVDPSAQQSDPSSPFFDTRPPLAASFRFPVDAGTGRGTGDREPAELLVVNVHLSSKGGSGPLFGAVQPAAELQEDPAVNGSLDERRAQAEALLAFVDERLRADPGAKVVVLGDFNEFEFISPLLTLERSLVNLTRRLPPDERYSFVFRGNSQSLDHVLVSPALARRARLDAVHVNSELAETASRASDHDPLLVELRLPRR